jgi:hypothetical protein
MVERPVIKSDFTKGFLMPSKNEIDRVLTAIAAKHLGLTTLKMTGRGEIDSSPQLVWDIEKALRAAFEAGRASRSLKQINIHIGKHFLTALTQGRRIIFPEIVHQLAVPRCPEDIVREVSLILADFRKDDSENLSILTLSPLVFDLVRLFHKDNPGTFQVIVFHDDTLTSVDEKGQMTRIPEEFKVYSDISQKVLG